MDGQGKGHLSVTRAATWQMSDGDSSSMLTTSGLAHPHLYQQDGLVPSGCAGEAQGLLLQVWQLVGDSGSSLAFMTLRPARPPASGVHGVCVRRLLCVN